LRRPSTPEQGYDSIGAMASQYSHSPQSISTQLVSFQLMYIFGDMVTMFWGKRLFSLLMYKRHFIHVTGDVPIEIVITFFIFIKHYFVVFIFIETNASLIRELGPLF
jgi:hypothetical protein